MPAWPKRLELSHKTYEGWDQYGPLCSPLINPAASPQKRSVTAHITQPESYFLLQLPAKTFPFSMTES